MDLKDKQLGQVSIYREESKIPFAIYQFEDKKVVVRMVSDGLCALMETKREELVDRFANDMYQNVEKTDALSIASAAYRFATGEDDIYDVVYREKLSAGTEYSMIHAVGQHFFDENGERYALVTYDNITDALASNENTKKVFESSVERFYQEDDNATCIISQEDNIVYYTNKKYLELIPPVKAFDSGLTYWDYFYAGKHAEYASFWKECVGKGIVLTREVETNTPMAVRVREISWAGTPAYVVNIEVQSSLYYDVVTGLPNEAYFELSAWRTVEKYAQNGQDCVCLYYDIAGMKVYNKQNGYAAGDAFLKGLAQILRECYRDSLVCHFENDHFCIVTAAEGVESCIEDVNRQVAKLGGSNPVEVKVGIVKLDGNKDRSVTTFVDLARAAKDSIREVAGKSYRFFDAELEKQLQDQKYITEHIDEAIEKEEIRIYYQPIIRTLTGQLSGYEVLARWESPELGFLSPASFIPALEQAHEIHKLDSYVIRRICRDLRKYLDEGRSPNPVSFNLSRLDFQLCDMFDVVEDAVMMNGLDRGLVNIEITESVFAGGNSIRQEIQRFHNAGYQVWMDDFGSGYSSLNTLKDFDVDKLKIDMGFLSTFTDRSKSIISSIVQMAKHIGIRTLAEGVETEEQYAFLRDIGCEEVQGFYFSKPLPADEVLYVMHEKGIRFEEAEDKPFYLAAGRTELRSDVPTVIYEWRNGRFDMLLANQSYRQLLEEAGVDVEMADESINDPGRVFYNRVYKRFVCCAENHVQDHYTFQYEGTYFATNLSVISQKEDAMICKVELLNTHIMLKKQREAQEARGEDENFDSNKKTLLIADDEPVNCMILGEMLKDKYNLLYAEDGIKALEMIDENIDDIAAVLLDMVMPVMDGVEVLRRIREDNKTKHLPVLGLSVAADLEIDLLRAGINQFIAKPYDNKDLIIAKIENVIRF